MQYDVCINRGRNATTAPYFLVLQHDHMDALPTRIVAPLLRLERSSALSRVMVPVQVAGEDLVASMPELFSLPTKLLGPPVVNLSDRHDAIIAALDFLITG